MILSWTGWDYCPQPTQSVSYVKVRSALSPISFDEFLKLGISLNPEDTQIDLFLIPSILKFRPLWILLTCRRDAVLSMVFCF